MTDKKIIKQAKSYADAKGWDIKIGEKEVMFLLGDGKCIPVPFHWFGAKWIDASFERLPKVIENPLYDDLIAAGVECWVASHHDDVARVWRDDRTWRVTRMLDQKSHMINFAPMDGGDYVKHFASFEELVDYLKAN